MSHTSRKKPVLFTILALIAALIINFLGLIPVNKALAAVHKPIFSHMGGFYEKSFKLELSVPDDAEIYYTLDGTEPTRDSIKYTAPIEIKEDYIKPGYPVQIITKGVKPQFPLSYIKTNPKEANDRMQWKAPEKDIFKATVVRARAINSLGVMSDVVTNTYFVSKNIKEKYTFPVVSIVGNPDDFFDYERGIYVPGKVYDDNGYGESYWGVPNANYHQRGAEWERPVYLEFYEPDGELGFALNGGMRIHGTGSRVLPQKSLRFYARSEYDTINKIEYDIFNGLKKPYSDEALDKFKRLVFRTGGQEGYKTIFKDMMLQSLIEHTDLDIQNYRPTVVFLNGEYWGIHTIRQRYDLKYLEIKYNANEEDFVILDTAAGRLGDGISGDERHFKDMVEFLRNNDITIEENYEYIKTQMDVDNYINYCVYNVYIGNFDWPSNNVNIWRYKTEYDPDAPYGLDGRWRWMVFDVDYGFGFKDVSYNSLNDLILTQEEGSDKKDWSTELFRLLIKNDDFKNKFLNSFADHMNTSFTVDRVIEKIDYFESLFEPEMQEHIDRWHYPKETVSAWKKEVDKLRTYAKKRPEYILEHLEEAFGVSEMVNVTINGNHEHGFIKVNLATIDENAPGVSENVFPWTGKYFKDTPIEITALNKPGYIFHKWKEIGEKSNTIRVNLADDLTLTPLYIADPYNIMDMIDNLPDVNDITLEHKPKVDEIRQKLNDALSAGLKEEDILNLDRFTELENKVTSLANSQKTFLIYMLVFTIIVGGVVLYILSKVQERKKNKK